MNPFTESSPELQTAIEAAQAGCRVIRRYFEQGFTTQTKFTAGDAQGLVTQADIESEQVIVATIRNAFPEHAILAEETLTETGQQNEMWIIDPLDGTNNFAHGIPHFAVSIAFYRSGRPEWGVVVDPIRDDWFLAGQGRGAWANARPVHVNQQDSITQAIVAVGFYYDRGDMMRATLRTIQDLFESNVQGIRRMGTAALDLIQVGLGRFGGYFEYQLSPWDFVAAQLFVQEAGGQVPDFPIAAKRRQHVAPSVSLG